MRRVEIGTKIPDDVFQAFKRAASISLNRLLHGGNPPRPGKYFCEYIQKGMVEQFGNSVLYRVQRFPNILFSLLSGVSEVNQVAVKVRCDFDKDTITGGLKDLFCKHAVRLVSRGPVDLNMIAYLASFQQLKKGASSKSSKRYNVCNIALDYLQTDREFSNKEYAVALSQWEQEDQAEKELFQRVLNEDPEVNCVPILFQVDSLEQYCAAFYRVMDRDHRR